MGGKFENAPVVDIRQHDKFSIGPLCPDGERLAAEARATGLLAAKRRALWSGPAMTT
jgi:hypothetical protein